MPFSDWIPNCVVQSVTYCGKLIPDCAKGWTPYLLVAGRDAFWHTVGWALTEAYAKDPSCEGEYTLQDYALIPAALFVIVGAGQAAKYYFLDPKDPEKSKKHHAKQSALRAIADGVDAAVFFYAHVGMNELLNDWVGEEYSNHFFLITMFTDAAATATSDAISRAIIHCCAQTGEKLPPLAMMSGVTSFDYTLIEGVLKLATNPGAGTLGVTIWGGATITGSVITYCFAAKNSVSPSPTAVVTPSSVGVQSQAGSSNSLTSSRPASTQLSLFGSSMRRAVSYYTLRPQPPTLVKQDHFRGHGALRRLSNAGTTGAAASNTTNMEGGLTRRSPAKSRNAPPPVVITVRAPNRPTSDKQKLSPIADDDAAVAVEEFGPSDSIVPRR